jgi:hypothetical protein
MSDFWSMCKPLSQFNGGKLIGLYGRGSSGKTTLSASFPNPVFIIFDDQGLNAVKTEHPDVPFVDASGFTAPQLLSLLDSIEQIPNDVERTYIFSTFSVWIDNHSQLLMAEKKKSHMNQDLWGEHNSRVQMVIAKCASLAKNGKRIILEFHERVSVIEGYEQELVPEIGVNAGPSIQKYLVGMLNYAFHTSIKQFTNPENNQQYSCYTVDINPLNAYYWIKAQGGSSELPPYAVVGKGNGYETLKQFFPEL